MKDQASSQGSYVYEDADSTIFPTTSGLENGPLNFFAFYCVFIVFKKQL